MNHPGCNHHTNTHRHGAQCRPADNGELIVGFPAHRRRQEDQQVRFASYSTMKVVASVLTVCSKQELLYSSDDFDMMELQTNREAKALARALLFPSDKDLQE